MTAEHTPALPRFPQLADHPFDADEAAAATMLSELWQWRDRWRAWLEGPTADGSLTLSLAQVLRATFAVDPPTALARLPYALAPFPPDGVAPAVVALAAVLRWRAAIYDFLSDAWDTLGPADFEMDACQRVAAALLPDGPRRCGLCLAAWPEGEAAQRTHYAVCPVTSGR